jgi:hypothetical protein
MRTVLSLAAALASGCFAATQSSRAEVPAHVLAPHSAPRAVADVPGDGLVLWAGGPQAEQFTWPLGVSEPLRVALASFRVGFQETQWAANARGDVVLIGDALPAVRVLAIDAAGDRAQFREPASRPWTIGKAMAAIGDDGTAAVAWTQVRRDDDELPFVWVRIRPPGGVFAPALMLRGAGEVRELALAIRPDGVVELVHADYDGSRHQLVYHELRAGLPPSPATPISATAAASPFYLDLVPGGVGVSRVVFEGGEWSQWVVAALRTGDATWTRQVIGRGAFEAESLTAAADGSALLAYPRGHRVWVHQAAGGQPFGPPQQVGTIPERWDSYATALSRNTDGRVLLAWIEYSTAFHRSGYTCENAGCFERVMAVAAQPDGRYGSPWRLSPLGSMPGDVVLTGIASGGDHLATWRETTGSIYPAGALVAVRGSATDLDPPAAPRDRRPPAVEARLDVRRLRAAVRGRRLRLRISCDEPCALRFGMYSRARLGASLSALPAAVLDRPGTKIVGWRLSPRRQQRLRKLLRAGHLAVPASATDAAGNIVFLGVRITGPTSSRVAAATRTRRSPSPRCVLGKPSSDRAMQVRRSLPPAVPVRTQFGT